MATIVEQIETGYRYLLLGAGYGKYQSARPNMILGDLLPVTKEGSETVLAVCNEEGRIGWVRSEEMRVVSVDGVEPAKALA